MGGLSLVELMIALALSALLVGLVLRVYVNQSGIHHQQRASAELQQSSLIALDSLRQSLLEAAPGVGAASSRRIALASPVSPIPHQSRQHPRFDSLVLVFDEGHDCTGSSLDSAPPRWKQFRVVDSELRCRDSDGQVVALVSGVDAFQVRYGMDWQGDGRELQYVPALDAARAEHRVLAVRIGLVLRSQSPVLQDGPGLPSDTLLLDRSLDQILPHAMEGQGDRYLRSVVETTVALRKGFL